jgi:hypothetical protein
MPLHVYWDNHEKTIIRCEADGLWTWDEYHQALDQIAAMMREVEHRVDLMNIRGNDRASMPRGSAMPHFKRAMKIMPPNRGLMVLVTNSAFGKSMVSVFLKVYGQISGDRLVMAGSIEEAYRRIAEDRARQLTRV